MRSPLALALVSLAALPALAQEAAPVACGVFSTSYSHSVSRCQGPERDYLVYFAASCAVPNPCNYVKWAVLSYSCEGGVPSAEPWVSEALGAPGCAMTGEYGRQLDEEIARFRQSSVARVALPPRGAMAAENRDDGSYFNRPFDPDAPAVAHGAELGLEPRQEVAVFQPASTPAEPVAAEPPAPIFTSVGEVDGAPSGMMSSGIVEDYRPTEAYELTEFLMGPQPTGIPQTLWVAGKYYSVRATPGLELPPAGAEGRRMSLLLAGMRLTASRAMTADEARDKAIVLLPQIQRQLQKRLMWLASMASCAGLKLTSPFRLTFTYLPSDTTREEAVGLRSDVYELGCAFDSPDFTEVPPLTLEYLGTN